MIIPQIVAELQKVDKDISAIDIADALWLAVQITRRDAPSQDQSNRDPQTHLAQKSSDELVRPQTIARERETFRIRRKQTVGSAQKANIYPYAQRTGAHRSSRQDGAPIELPTANALPGILKLARALRPLGRRIPSRTTFRIDEQATAERLADERMLLPVWQPVLERWLDVVLVYDVAASMKLWRPTVIVLHRFLACLSAFRDVRLWELVTDAPDGNVRLFAGLDGATKGQTPRSYQELIDPGGKRLILVLSDCVARAWHTGVMGRVLSAWGQTTPVTLIQVLPVHFWRRTALAHETAVHVTAHQPGLPNAQLGITRKETDLFDDTDDEQATGIVVPIITLEPRALAPWANMMAGKGSTATAGYRFDTRRMQAPPRTGTSVKELTDVQRLQRFRSMVSPTAFQLASLLSEGPVSLPIMYLIQQQLLPESWQTHIAEILLGGILQLSAEYGQTSRDVYQQQYEFVGNIRKCLRDTVPTATSKNVITLISNYVAQQQTSTHHFPALVAHPHASQGVPISADMRVLATATADVLRRRGFDQVADGLEAAVISDVPLPLSEHAVSPRPAVQVDPGNETDTTDGPGQPDDIRETEEVEELVEVPLTIAGLRQYVSVVQQKLDQIVQQEHLNSPAYLVAAHDLMVCLPIKIIPEPAPLPRGSRMPFARNPLFQGRDEHLRHLAQAFKHRQADTLSATVVLTGMGGIGKTQLAAEFIYRYGQFFAGGVFWLSFADPANISAQIAQCGGTGGMNLRPDFHTLELTEQVAAVQQAWVAAVPRLLVFDNVDSEDSAALVQQYRPPRGGCHVLITSRRGTWDPLLNITALPLGVYVREDSIALLRRFRADLDDTNADTLAGELGDLPLALHMAGSFLRQYAMTSQGDPAVFLARLREPTLLEHPALMGRSTGTVWSYHERSMARAFALSYDRLDPTNVIDTLARALLARAAHFAPGETIPRDLLLATLDTDNAQLVRDALERLMMLGLLGMEASGELILHQLLAQFVILMGDDDAAQIIVEQEMNRVASALNMQGIPAPFLPLLSHLRHITERALQRADEQAAMLATNLGYCLHHMFADYAAARPLYERALTIREQVLGPAHPDTAASLNNLAVLLTDMGDYSAARPLYEHALAVREQVLGPAHPDTATSLNNLAVLLRSMGSYSAARPLYERALAVLEQVLGPAHPDTATSLNNLAELLRLQGDYAAARPLYERALAIREEVLGPTHPDTASSLNDLAILLSSTGDYASARRLYDRALAISEQVFGPEHPNTATSLNNLAGVLEAQGEYAAARPLYERALTIREHLLGPTHPNTAASLNNLAGLLRAQGEYTEARPLYEHALAIYEQELGPTHPDTASSLSNLALLLRVQGEYAAARPLYERALAIREQELGPTHPDTANSLKNLAGLLERQGEYAVARPLYERALAIYEQVLGPTHPDTATSLNNLAELLRVQGEYVTARPLYERALAIYEQVLGPTHPNTTTSRNNLILLLQSQGDDEAARLLLVRANKQPTSGAGAVGVMGNLHNSPVITGSGNTNISTGDISGVSGQVAVGSHIAQASDGSSAHVASSHSVFDQRGQRVQGNQYNAARDITIGREGRANQPPRLSDPRLAQVLQRAIEQHGVDDLLFALGSYTSSAPDAATLGTDPAIQARNLVTAVRSQHQRSALLEALLDLDEQTLGTPEEQAAWRAWTREMDSR